MGQSTSKQKQPIKHTTTTTWSIHEKLLKQNDVSVENSINYDELINEIKKAKKVEMKLYY